MIHFTNRVATALDNKVKVLGKTPGITNECWQTLEEIFTKGLNFEVMEDQGCIVSFESEDEKVVLRVSPEGVFSVIKPERLVEIVVVEPVEEDKPAKKQAKK